MKLTQLLSILFIIALSNAPIYAGTVSWNTSGDGNWSAPSNWSPLETPVQTDTVVINNAGSGKITLDTDAGIMKLTVGGSHQLVLSQYSLTVSSAEPLKVFVTSETGHGKLYDWTSSGGHSKLQAGDAICQAAADSAGLSGTYKVWLSTDVNDAYCWIQGYTGQKADNCGQSSLPVAAGPWVRTDGNPFAATIDKLVNNGPVYTPARYDENGSVVVSGVYWTGTYTTGNEVTGANCDNWTGTSSSSYASMGGVDGTNYFWSGMGGYPCSGSYPLLCFQTGAGPALANLSLPYGAKKVFLTSTTQNGNLGGIAGADAICVARATAAAIPNAAHFKAWISDDSTDAIDHVTVNSAGPWYRLDGVRIAYNKAELLTVPLFTAIAVTENGDYRGSFSVWTGTQTTGTKSTFNCVNWTHSGSSDGDGLVGTAGYSSYVWTAWGPMACDQNGALYCFEDD